VHDVIREKNPRPPPRKGKRKRGTGEGRRRERAPPSISDRKTPCFGGRLFRKKVHSSSQEGKKKGAREKREGN